MTPQHTPPRLPETCRFADACGAFAHDVHAGNALAEQTALQSGVDSRHLGVLAVEASKSLLRNRENLRGHIRLPARVTLLFFRSRPSQPRYGLNGVQSISDGTG